MSPNQLFKTIDGELPVDKVIGRGCYKSVRSTANITCVLELICSQENAPGSHKSPREIEKLTGISRLSVC